MASGLIEGGVDSRSTVGGGFIPAAEIKFSAGIEAAATLLDGLDIFPELLSEADVGGSLAFKFLVTGGIDARSKLGGNLPTANKSGTQKGSADTGSITGGGFLSRAANCRVSGGLERLKALQNRFTEIDAALQDLLQQPFSANVIDDVRAGCELLPDLGNKPFFDLNELDNIGPDQTLGQLLCDEKQGFDDLDPRVQLAIMSDKSTDAANCILGEFDRFLRSKSSFPVIDVGSQVLRDVKRGGVDQETRDALECLSQAVKGLGEDSEFLAGPFSDFLSVLSNVPFRFQVPKIFSSEVQKLLNELDNCEIRIATIKEAQKKKQRKDLPVNVTIEALGSDTLL